MHGDKRRGEQFKSMLGRVGMKAQAEESIEKHEGLISSTRPRPESADVGDLPGLSVSVMIFVDSWVVMAWCFV